MRLSPSDPTMVGVLVMACLGMTASGAASLYITRYATRKAITARLLLYLHVSLLLEELCTIPFLFTFNHGLCKFVGFVQIYAGLCNILAMGLLVVHYVNYISSYSPRLMKLIARQKKRIIFGLPLITILPLSTDSYGVTHEVFCGLPSDTRTQNLWAIFVLHLWLWIVLIVSFRLLAGTIYQALKLDVNLAGKILGTIGVYVMVTISAWLERTIPRILSLVDPHFHSPPVTYIIQVYIIYIMAIIYAVLLFRDKGILQEYQQYGREGEEENEFDDEGQKSSIHLHWNDVENTMHSRPSDGMFGGDITSNSTGSNRISMELKSRPSSTGPGDISPIKDSNSNKIVTQSGSHSESSVNNLSVIGKLDTNEPQPSSK